MAWIKLYKVVPSWKEALCILIHDWGYYKCERMEDEDGQWHPLWAACRVLPWGAEYFKLVVLHSRFLARRLGQEPSRLCLADKLGTALMPTWMWVGLGRLSGEVYEYCANGNYETVQENPNRTAAAHFNRYKQICQDWVKAGAVGMPKEKEVCKPNN